MPKDVTDKNATRLSYAHSLGQHHQNLHQHPGGSTEYSRPFHHGRLRSGQQRYSYVQGVREGPSREGAQIRATMMYGVVHNLTDISPTSLQPEVMTTDTSNHPAVSRLTLPESCGTNYQLILLMPIPWISSSPG
ncbi:hypothetical protein SNE40_020206 [Patella caerulea]|uniref:Uncharacterized protein n=1 Tax=Patella caerulea TaxID=87958 RepID=A0AAN8J4L2_PATCE